MIQIPGKFPVRVFGSALFISFIILSSTRGMRHTHVPSRMRVVGRSQAYPHILIRKYARRAPDDSFHDEASIEAKRKQTWERIKREVDQRANEFRAKAAKHQAQETKLRAQLAHHTRYARIYHTLAELEQDKFRLFALSIEKLNESCKYYQEPDLETETMLLKALHETYNQLYDALPEDEKI